MKGIVHSSQKFIQENFVNIIFIVYVFIMWIFIQVVYNIQFKEKEYKVKKLMVIERFNENKKKAKQREPTFFSVNRNLQEKIKTKNKTLNTSTQEAFDTQKTPLNDYFYTNNNLKSDEAYFY